MRVTLANSAKRQEQIDEEDMGPESGLTLLELLVVIVLLGLIAAAVALSVSGRLGKAKTDIARLQIDQLATAVEIYILDVGSPPSATEGLDALIDAPPGTNDWNGPYVKKADAIIDPWGKPFLYRVAGEGGHYDILSYGADGIAGGTGDAADVSNR